MKLLLKVNGDYRDDILDNEISIYSLKIVTGLMIFLPNMTNKRDTPFKYSKYFIYPPFKYSKYFMVYTAQKTVKVRYELFQN